VIVTHLLQKELHLVLNTFNIEIDIAKSAIRTKITFINHASLLIQIGNTNIITDPIYARSIGWIAPRMQKAGIPFEDLPQIDIILISHNDYDHLNTNTLRKLRRQHQSHIIVPLGDAKYAYDAGFTSVIEMNEWDTQEYGQLRITCVPAKHKSNRALFQRDKRLCCGYVIESPLNTIYFAGDTGYGTHFKEISSRFSINAALLPISAYKPHNWFKDIHLNSLTAIQAFIDLKSDMLIPMHWGTFKISDEPLQEPPLLLQEEAKRIGISDKIRILKNGDAVQL
jgi:L-ascorbate metabolism protein UlaG (beta-lactamase superfamily)